MWKSCLIFIVILVESTAVAGPIENALVANGFKLNDNGTYVYEDSRLDSVESIEVRGANPQMLCYHLKYNLAGMAAMLVVPIKDAQVVADNIRHNLKTLRYRALRVMFRLPAEHKRPDMEGARDA
jgi:hypothetical protein